MKNVIQCVNYIRARGLNHWQFKAFREYLDCNYPDVVYFSAAQCLSRAATLKRLRNIRQEIRQFMESKHHNVAFLINKKLAECLRIHHRHCTAPVRTELETTRKNHHVHRLFENICAHEKMNCFIFSWVEQR